MWPFSTQVNTPENDDPSIIEPIELATDAASKKNRRVLARPHGSVTARALRIPLPQRLRLLRAAKRTSASAVTRALSLVRGRSGKALCGSRYAVGRQRNQRKTTVALAVRFRGNVASFWALAASIRASATRRLISTFLYQIKRTRFSAPTGVGKDAAYGSGNQRRWPRSVFAGPMVQLAVPRSLIGVF